MNFRSLIVFSKQLIAKSYALTAKLLLKGSFLCFRELSLKEREPLVKKKKKLIPFRLHENQYNGTSQQQQSYLVLRSFAVLSTQI